MKMEKVIFFPAALPQQYRQLNREQVGIPQAARHVPQPRAYLPEPLPHQVAPPRHMLAFRPTDPMIHPVPGSNQSLRQRFRMATSPTAKPVGFTQ
jgi:hypothetical protein